MKKVLIIFFLVAVTFIVNGQIKNIDSLKYLLANAKDNSTRIEYLNSLHDAYIWNHPDSAIPYVLEQLRLANQIKNNHSLVRANLNYAWINLLMGNYPEALHYSRECLQIAEQSKRFYDMAVAYDMIANIYNDEGDYELAIKYDYLALSILEANRAKREDYELILNGIVTIYDKFNHLDSALKYARLLRDIQVEVDGKVIWSPIPYFFGNIYSKMGNYADAILYYHSGVDLARNSNNNSKDLMDNYLGLAKTFKKTGQTDSSVFFAKKVLELSRSAYYVIVKIEALNLLADIYKTQHNSDSVSKFLDLSIAAKDSVFSVQKMMQMQDATFKEQVRQLELKEQARQLRNRIILFSTIAALIVFLLIAYILWRNNRHKQKAYALLQKQKQEIDLQKSKVEQTLEELKNTQSQLIQSEKMASLGELTAGIAHEIQNPLNFVNNFSEVNKELLVELNEEIDKGNYEEVKIIAADIAGNEEKISHHGKRADSIVKGMLQHSRSTSTVKEPTDINSLTDEYLRLAYHGLRAKDKSFNATMKTDYDETIGKINIIPQDIGRVILNVVTNAFYTVNEKKKVYGNSYEPTVSLITKKRGDTIEIKVVDNGNGIPQKVVYKIFQPFFTTKPTGQGTGLGLSLAYDIVKTHGGELKVETKEGEGSEFLILIPF